MIFKRLLIISAIAIIVQLFFAGFCIMGNLFGPDRNDRVMAENDNNIVHPADSSGVIDLEPLIYSSIDVYSSEAKFHHLDRRRDFVAYDFDLNTEFTKFVVRSQYFHSSGNKK